MSSTLEDIARGHYYTEKKTGKKIRLLPGDPPTECPKCGKMRKIMNHCVKKGVMYCTQVCNTCHAEEARLSRLNNPESYKDSQGKYRRSHPEKVAEKYKRAAENFYKKHGKHASGIINDKSLKHASNWRKLWTEEDEDFILYSDLPLMEISKIIGRSIKGIIQRRWRLTDPDSDRPWMFRTI